MTVIVVTNPKHIQKPTIMLQKIYLFKWVGEHVKYAQVENKLKDVFIIKNTKIVKNVKVKVNVNK